MRHSPGIALALALVFTAGICCQKNKKEAEDQPPAAPTESPEAFVPRIYITLEFDPEPGREVSDDDKESTVRNLRKRLSVDLEQVHVRREGSDRVQVAIGDDVSTEELSSAFTMAGKMSFQMAHPDYREFTTETDPEEVIIPGATLVPFRGEEEEPGELRHLLVRDRVEIRGDQISRAQAVNEFGRWSILLTLDKEGGERLFELSKEHNIRDSGTSGLPFAIILDGQILSAPVFNEPISGGRAQISGSFTEVEARGLASAMQTPLAIPLRVLFKSAGPGSLDADGS